LRLTDRDEEIYIERRRKGRTDRRHDRMWERKRERDKLKVR
jgi:hypothetical protein